MSGGVDSSLSTALLKDAGYYVVGVFIKVWSPPWLPCVWPEERRDAMRVAAHLEIPFVTLDLVDHYKKEVVDYMVAEYKAGRTPNPDVMCNKEVKFGAFLRYAKEQGADFVATGHYAQRIDTNATIELHAGVDGEKDQSYFLWTLQQNQLQNILFPVGGMKKSEVRKLAKQFVLPVAEKKDSQGLCFVGHVDMADFLKQFFTPIPGAVLNIEGREIGTHEGAELYTIGQRHGFIVTKKTAGDTPLYVISKDLTKNTVTVGEKHEETAAQKEVKIINCSWTVTAPEENKKLSARIRYRAKLSKCIVKNIQDGEARVLFEKPEEVVTPGQSLVLYDGTKLVGGGVIA